MIHFNLTRMMSPGTVFCIVQLIVGLLTKISKTMYQVVSFAFQAVTTEIVDTTELRNL